MSTEKEDIKLQLQIAELIAKNDNLQKEIDYFKTKSPIVGVRWYGNGGFGIGLSRMVNGVNKVSLEGYNDKAVIDYSAWVRVRNTEECQNGILVRDDTVIDEEAVIGLVAKPDQNPSKNGYTREQLIGIANGKLSTFKEYLDRVDHYFPVNHLIKILKEFEIVTPSKVKAADDRYIFLFTTFRYSLLHHHDLVLACDRIGVPYEGRSDKELINELVTRELKLMSE